MAKETDRRRLADETQFVCANTGNECNEMIEEECYQKINGKRKRGRKAIKASTNAARERSRVQNLKQAFLELQRALPNVPSGTKLSKLDILLLATNYISHLMSKLSNGHLREHLSRLKDTGTLHPIKKWPMRSRLYVSDPMWLYRSSRQSLMTSESVEESPSPSSPSISYEESSPSLDIVDLPSPSDSSADDSESLSARYRHSCREQKAQIYSVVAPDVELKYSYGNIDNTYMAPEQHGFEPSACLYQKVIPDLRVDNDKL